MTTGTRTGRVSVGEAVVLVTILAAALTGIPAAPRKDLSESHRIRKAGGGPESLSRVASDREPPVPSVPSSTHRGKAPPVNPFNGEPQEVLFEDWLPSLHRAAEWNGWSSSETLISSLRDTCVAKCYRNGASSLLMRRLP